MTNQKRGQFYLVAAIIIISLIVGFAVVSNYAKKKAVIKLYDLKQELGIESGSVLDYGTYNKYNKEAMKNLLQDFIEEYVQYTGEGKNLYFIFGNSEEITVMVYQDLI